MARINSSLKYQSFLYDFAVNGGAISSIGMGIFIPAGSYPIGCTVIPVTDLTSAGAAVVDIGIAGRTTMFVDNANSLGTGDLGDYNAATYGLGPAFVTGSPAVVLNTPFLTAEGEVLVTISAFVLTAGAFKATVYYQEY